MTQRLQQPEDEIDYGEYTAHPAADRFPLLEGDAFETFVADIREHGQQETIKLTPDGKQIADGRNRARACRVLGLKSKVERLPTDWTEERVIAFIVSANLQRIHLTDDQRAGVAADLEPLYAEAARQRRLRGLRRGSKPAPQEDPNEGKSSGQASSVRTDGTGRKRGPEAVEQAAKEVGVSPSRVKRFKRLQRKDPEAAQEVRAGRRKLGTAAGPTRSRHTTQQPSVSRRSSLGPSSDTEQVKSALRQVNRWADTTKPESEVQVPADLLKLVRDTGQSLIEWADAADRNLPW